MRINFHILLILLYVLQGLCLACISPAPPASSGEILWQQLDKPSLCWLKQFPQGVSSSHRHLAHAKMPPSLWLVVVGIRAKTLMFHGQTPFILVLPYFVISIGSHTLAFSNV